MWQPTESSPDTRLSQVPQKQYLQTAPLIPGQTVTNFASPGLLQSEQRQYGSTVSPLPGQTFSTPLRMNRASSATTPSFKQPTYQQPGYIYNQRDTYYNQRYQYQTGESNIDNLINKGECEPSIVKREIVPIYCKCCGTYARYPIEFTEAVGRRFQCRFCKIIIEVPNEYFQYLDTTDQYLERLELLSDKFKYIATKDYCKDTYNNQRYQYQTGEPNIDNLINKGECEPSVVVRENVPIYCKRCDMYAKYLIEFSGAIGRRCRFCKIIIEVPNEYFRRFQYFDTIGQFLKRLELLSDKFKYIPIKDYCKDMYNNQRYQYQTGEPNIDNLINKGECEPSIVIRKIVPIYCKRCDTYARYYMEFFKGAGRKFQCRFCKIIIEVPDKYFSQVDKLLDRYKRTEVIYIRRLSSEPRLPIMQCKESMCEQSLLKRDAE